MKALKPLIYLNESGSPLLIDLKYELGNPLYENDDNPYGKMI